VARVQLLGEKGETQALPSTPLNQNLFPTGKSEAMIGIPLLFDRATPGKYRPVVIASETTFNQSVTAQTDLQFR
jgi:hypothetical protein